MSTIRVSGRNRKKDAIVALVALAACATAPPPPPSGPPPDPWAPYVGHWTVQQAIMAMGRPTDTFSMGAGLTLYEWTVPYQEQVVTGAYTSRGGTYRPWAGGSYRTSAYETGQIQRWTIIRCTFDANSVLVQGQTTYR